MNGKYGVEVPLPEGGPQTPDEFGRQEGGIIPSSFVRPSWAALTQLGEGVAIALTNTAWNAMAFSRGL